MSQEAEHRLVEGNDSVVGRRAKRQLRWLPTAIVLANLLYAGYMTAQSLAGIGHHTGSAGVIGALFLVFALVPSNVLHFGWWSRKRWVRGLAGLRKPLGISAGAWVVAHSVVGAVEYFDFSTTASVLGQLWIGDMALGVAATLIFAALIAPPPLTPRGAAWAKTGNGCNSRSGSPSRWRSCMPSSPAPASTTSNHPAHCSSACRSSSSRSNTTRSVGVADAAPGQPGRTRRSSSRGLRRRSSFIRCPGSPSAPGTSPTDKPPATRPLRNP